MTREAGMATMSMCVANNIEDMERNLREVDHFMNTSEILVGRLSDEDLGVNTVVDAHHAEVRNGVMSSIERRRDTFGGARPMDVDKHDTDHYEPYETWWGGADSGWNDLQTLRSQAENDWMEDGSPDVSQVQPQWRQGLLGFGRDGKGGR